MTAEVLADNVVSVTHDTKNVTVVMSDGKQLYNEISYYSILRIINDCFVRVNKNSIVNLSYATRIDKNVVYMANDDSYEIEKEHLKDVTNMFYRLKLEKFRPN